MKAELVQLFQEASKAADAAAVHTDGGEDDESRCVDALNRLKKIRVTSQLLISTQVGKGLRRLTKHPRKTIQTVANDLIQYWKQIVTEESNSSKRKDQSVVTNNNNHHHLYNNNIKKTVNAEDDDDDKSTKAPKTEENSTPNTNSAARAEATTPKKNNGAEIKIIKEPKSSSVLPKPDPRKFSFPRCNDPARDKVRRLLLEALSKVYAEVEGGDMIEDRDPGAMAATVESVMFGRWGMMNGAQKAKYRSVMFNIKDGNNPDFRRKVLLGQVKAERLLTMNTQEMASDQRQQENKKIEQKAMFDCELGGAPKATTDQFKCGRCGQRKCTYYQMQTRSADEPMTTYVTCVNCNNHWKFC